MNAPRFVALCSVLTLAGCQFLGSGITIREVTEVGSAPRQHLTAFRREVIDAHRQLYGFSCIPSSVEMVLKLLGRVPASYYELQEEWKNKTDGNFINFEGRTIAGVRFHQQFSLPRDRRFPLTALFEDIHRELCAGRYVIVGLAAGDGWHNWVIYDEGLDGEFIAVTKYDDVSVELRDVKRVIRQMRGTDIGTYVVTGTADRK